MSVCVWELSSLVTEWVSEWDRAVTRYDAVYSGFSLQILVEAKIFYMGILKEWNILSWLMVCKDNLWVTEWLTMNGKLRETQTICPMWMHHSHVYLPTQQPTLISTLPKITIHTYTHSPGLEQFPLLSLQPSRQIAKARRKRQNKTSQYAALNAVPLSLKHWYWHIHPPIMKLTVARSPWHHIPTTRPHRAPVFLKQPTGSLDV